MASRARGVWLAVQLTFAVGLLAAFLNLTAAALLLAASEHLSRPEPEPTHTVRVHLHGSHYRYYGPIAGRCINWSFPLLGGIAAGLAVLGLIDRRLRRDAHRGVPR